MTAAARLALGTAQFGMAYGITNRKGRVPPTEIARILDCARAAGIDTIDTAAAYGESEAELGRAGVRDFRVIGKLGPVPPATPDLGGWFQREAGRSLERLGIDSFHAVLLHRPQQVHDDPEIHSGLASLRHAGMTALIGVSVYDPGEADWFARNFAPDLVQAPLSVIDRRIVDSGLVARLSEQGIAVHARSVFLQGLLLSAELRDTRFDQWRPVWIEWERWLSSSGLTALEAALRYVIHQPVERVVVGVDSVTQLEAIIAAADGPPPAVPPGIASRDDALINPVRWVTA